MKQAIVPCYCTKGQWAVPMPILLPIQLLCPFCGMKMMLEPKERICPSSDPQGEGEHEEVNS